MARELVEKGGEKFLKWARGRLMALTSLRQDLGLPAMRKQYKVGTSHIWVKSSEYGDWIRITGGGRAHLVARTGLREWTFFDWDGFVEIEKFDASAEAYAGEASQGCQICSASGTQLMVGTGASTGFVDGQYWLVNGLKPHDLSFGPVASTIVKAPGIISTSEGRWHRLSDGRFAHGAVGTSIFDFPFTGEGGVRTVVGDDFSVLSQVDVVGTEAGISLPGQLDDGGNSGLLFGDVVTPAAGDAVNLHDPFSGALAPAATITFSSGTTATQTHVGGAPGRIWRPRFDGTNMHVELSTPAGEFLSTVLLGPAPGGWIGGPVDDGQALFVLVDGDPKAFHVVESGGGLAATNVSNVGVMPYLLSSGPFAAWSTGIWGVGIHLINRQF